jgi:hypothetical protein
MFIKLKKAGVRQWERLKGRGQGIPEHAALTRCNAFL